MPKPIVLIPSDVRQVGIHPFHCVGEKYINAVVHGADAIPFVMPAWGQGKDLTPIGNTLQLDDILDRVDGVFLTGSPSNVHPDRYGGELREMMLDVQRDDLTFPLIDKCLEKAIPLFAVCRGFQELNVALGGTLHPAVHEVEGYGDHREDTTQSRENQYAASHRVSVQSGGLLKNLIGAETLEVNSLHGQGIRDLAPGLHIEAVADDGLIEAFSLPGQDVLGVQWHPEWKFSDNQHYRVLFDWFKERIKANMNKGAC
ncbi:MAG: gamma-glutamyl-gamma-aminobutyrate hydrolase family protein [Pseudomonadales bacterium]|nr:gamma-glutamyl-gamma-aminobutyrate hydrolase family protein [Pseudomonadales bacterium]MBO6597171.1 gamma-glutamyl-gamma-aminobutyrate hydrolase family protein [Pseudomonadales bacterium]MBO6655322.1 gamma-glutamyl-gamma-aminobutyrate hydrolase family protein [Pseudomonadales bacterium]MBO6823642.1 gamma-glutamyl-gamma-aminobutyrate hydrolase family protein [Pseudomonadales bacterium]